MVATSCRVDKSCGPAAARREEPRPGQRPQVARDGILDEEDPLRGVWRVAVNKDAAVAAVDCPADAAAALSCKARAEGGGGLEAE